MGETPATENKTAKTVDQIIQFALYDLALGAFKTYACAQLPWLKLPVVNQIFNLIVDAIVKPFYEMLAENSTMIVINIQTDEEKATYAKAEAALRAAHLSGNDAQIQAASVNFKSALANLVHFDGSYSS